MTPDPNDPTAGLEAAAAAGLIPADELPEPTEEQIAADQEATKRLLDREGFGDAEGEVKIDGNEPEVERSKDDVIAALVREKIALEQEVGAYYARFGPLPATGA